MAKEIATLSDRLSVEIFDLQKDSAKAAEIG